MMRKAPKTDACATDGELVALLSPAQREVLIYRAKGLQVKEIARVMDRSLPTIQGHLRHVHKRLGVSNGIEAGVIAVKAGLV